MCNSDREVPAFAEGVSISGPLESLLGKEYASRRAAAPGGEWVGGWC
jgi:hypothetical protein